MRCVSSLRHVGRERLRELQVTIQLLGYAEFAEWANWVNNWVNTTPWVSWAGSVLQPLAPGRDPPPVGGDVEAEVGWPFPGVVVAVAERSPHQVLAARPQGPCPLPGKTQTVSYLLPTVLGANLLAEGSVGETLVG